MAKTIINFKTPFKKAKNFAELVRNLDVVLREVQKVLLYGNYIQAEVTTSGVSVEHKLQREPTGWIIVDADADANVWRNATSDSKTINLISDATVNIKLYIW